MKGVIIAAGPGTELMPLTSNNSKPMIRILGKPLLQYAIERFRENGILDILIVVLKNQISVREYFGNGKEFGVNITYCYQPKDKVGISAAILSVKSLLENESKIFISHADIICHSDIISRTLNAAEAAGCDNALAVTLESDVRNYGVVNLSSDGLVESIEETASSSSNYVVAGFFLTTPSIFKMLEDGLKFNEAINELAKSDEEVAVGIWNSDWYDIGRPYDILNASKYLLSKLDGIQISSGAYVEDNVLIAGTGVIIESGAEILNGTKIKGPVYIAKNVFIGNNTLIRDHTEIGENSKIGFQTEIRSSVILNNVSIAGQSYIGATIIGENSTLYPAIITTNKHIPPAPIVTVIGDKKLETVEVPSQKFGAVVGPKCQIGVRTTLMPGARVDANVLIPPNTLIDGHYSK